jgi:hypothetical protein
MPLPNTPTSSANNGKAKTAKYKNTTETQLRTRPHIGHEGTRSSEIVNGFLKIFHKTQRWNNLCAEPVRRFCQSKLQHTAAKKTQMNSQRFGATQGQRRLSSSD